MTGDFRQRLNGHAHDGRGGGMCQATAVKEGAEDNPAGVSKTGKGQASRRRGQRGAQWGCRERIDLSARGPSETHTPSGTQTRFRISHETELLMKMPSERHVVKWWCVIQPLKTVLLVRWGRSDITMGP